jgi:large subunit ribosomal protein L30
MICLIRIKGQVGLNEDVKETLYRLRIRKKYACVVLEKPSEVQLGMIKAVKNLIAYGEISKETYKKLVDARGKKDTEGKLKPFFRLHPPRGGANTKVHYPLGVLGNHGKDIDKLVEKML